MPSVTAQCRTLDELMAHLTSSTPAIPVAIIGAGAVAYTMARILEHHGFPICAVVSRTPSSAGALAETLGLATHRPPPPATAIQTCRDLPESSAQAILLLVAVSDIALTTDLAGKLRQTFPQALLAMHTSGAHPADALQGAAPHVAALHPVAPFPKTFLSSNIASTYLRGVPAALHGEDGPVRCATAFARCVGMQPFRLDANPHSKAIYHAACCLASNATTAALCAAFDALHAGGTDEEHATSTLDTETALAVVTGLARSAVDTVEQSVRRGQHPARALTGPIARGDVSAVKLHATALTNSSPLRKYIQGVYSSMGRATALVATEESRIDARTTAAVLKVLEQLAYP